MAQAGIIVEGDGLRGGPSSPPRCASATASAPCKDGPFADSKEALGGYFVIEVPDLDAALEWAARAPCVHDGSVEIRPVLPMAPQGPA